MRPVVAFALACSAAAGCYPSNSSRKEPPVVPARSEFHCEEIALEPVEEQTRLMTYGPIECGRRATYVRSTPPR